MPAIGRRQVIAGLALLAPSLAVAQTPGYGPAPCRPDLFAGATERFFPLTEAEKAALRAMYPIGWPAR
jgi:hypothetical protein